MPMFGKCCCRLVRGRKLARGLRASAGVREPVFAWGDGQRRWPPRPHPALAYHLGTGIPHRHFQTGNTLMRQTRASHSLGAPAHLAQQTLGHSTWLPAASSQAKASICRVGNAPA
ncbi:MAG: hypothetical protein MUC60_13745 [Oscillatoria sp. Prado101]|nr:hypothetical protein [Oscillatoria sp. Prado101]